MKVLFVQGTPAPLRRFLRPNPVDTTAELGWSTIVNGALLALAEQKGYDVFITTDQSIRYQQNLTNRRLGIVVLMSTSWRKIKLRTTEIELASVRVLGGGYEEVVV